MRYKKFSVEHLKEVLNELGISERELCKRIGGTKTHTGFKNCSHQDSVIKD